MTTVQRYHIAPDQLQNFVHRRRRRLGGVLLVAGGIGGLLGFLVALPLVLLTGWSVWQGLLPVLAASVVVYLGYHNSVRLSRHWAQAYTVEVDEQGIRHYLDEERLSGLPKGLEGAYRRAEQRLQKTPRIDFDALVAVEPTPEGTWLRTADRDGHLFLPLELARLPELEAHLQASRGQRHSDE